ncbi:uncharacterized protein LOC128563567 isoform X2 [Nycticebus coucang]|uniref:uncharacterized protein LOC128563567 isoform X2 n=1 Tax=Nycticebus coucang TaxID=9470 RepID=UPI00234CB2C7|nr:uncharacterized protein LOC128563567 isoform X2 [Nycticebus coucang]XP_053414931.1 uncharacterized protein LOC128563567 isoform X2 [Nycticebus coucang]
MMKMNILLGFTNFIINDIENKCRNEEKMISSSHLFITREDTCPWSICGNKLFELSLALSQRCAMQHYGRKNEDCKKTDEQKQMMKMNTLLGFTNFIINDIENKCRNEEKMISSSHLFITREDTCPWSICGNKLFELSLALSQDIWASRTVLSHQVFSV